jgi:hypothetical protein
MIDGSRQASEASAFISRRGYFSGARFPKGVSPGDTLRRNTPDRRALIGGWPGHNRAGVIEVVNYLRIHQDKVDLVETAIDNAKERGPLGHIALAEESLAQNDEACPLNWRIGKLVLCVPGFGILDEAFAAIVAQAIERQRIAVRTEARDALSVPRVFTLYATEIPHGRLRLESRCSQLGVRAARQGQPAQTKLVRRLICQAS